MNSIQHRRAFRQGQAFGPMGKTEGLSGQPVACASWLPVGGGGIGSGGRWGRGGEPPLPLPCPRARATPPRSLTRTRRPLPLESGRVRRGREEEGGSGLRCLQDRPLLTVASMDRNQRRTSQQQRDSTSWQPPSCPYSRATPPRSLTRERRPLPLRSSRLEKEGEGRESNAHRTTK